MIDGSFFDLAEDGSKGGPPGWILSMMMAEQHQTRTHKVIPAIFHAGSLNRMYLYHICAF